MRKVYLIAFLLLSLAATAQNDPQKIIDEFFSRYKTNSNDAIDYLFSTNKWMNESKDQIENVKFKLNSTLKSVGKYYGFSPIVNKTVSEHLSFYTFLVRYERQPLRLNLLFYKADTQWAIYTFSFDDNLAEELKEATTAYRLKENY